MSEYEIMLILDPKADIKIVETLAHDIFKNNVKYVKKYDRTQLAYPINGSTTGLYILASINADSQLIQEFTRKANINQSIWRYVVINMDSERDHKIKKHYRFTKKEDRKKFYGDRSERSKKNEGQSFIKTKEQTKQFSDKE